MRNNNTVKLGYSFGWELRPKAPYDFALTVRKPARWSLFTEFERYEGRAIWTATYLKDRLAGIELTSKGTVSKPAIAARVHLAKPASRDERDAMKKELSAAIGADEDLAPFYAMAERDSILRHAIRDLRGMHDTSSPTIFPEACLAILLQMAPIERSNAMMSAFIGSYGAIAEFDGQRIRAWPSARRIGRLRASQLAKTCRVGYRAKLIVALARQIEAGFPSVSELATMPQEEAKKRLMDLPGIGDYSADIINPHGGFPIDTWSVEVFSKLFYGRVGAAIDKVKREGVRRWGRFAWMAFYYVVQDLPRLSKALKLELRLQ
jgi:3-methyladenine DNA glycosylase/8-oxoguanine DNA glycosylase